MLNNNQKQDRVCVKNLLVQAREDTNILSKAVRDNNMKLAKWTKILGYRGDCS
jgi:hypothetical protein